MTDSLRYFSQMVIPEIGLEGQKKIAAARVLVVGAGGLGCPVLTYLAAMGIGHIGIIDNDVVEMKNLHRQVLFNESDIGRLKVEAAAEKIKAQNNQLEIKTYAQRLAGINAEEIISGYDIVVDCCDNISTRYCIDKVTQKLGKPFVYGAVRQFEGQISVFNYKNGPAYLQLFPGENRAASELDCAIAGIIGFTTGIIGSLQVNEVLKIILDDKNTLSGEVLTIDLLSLNFRKFAIRF